MGRLRRRTLLASLGAASAGIAGCLDSGPGASDDDSNETDDQDDQDDGDPGGDEGSDDSGEDDGNGGEPQGSYQATIDHGEIVSDFTDGEWSGHGGSVTLIDEDEAISGDVALRVEKESDSYATAGYSFPDGLDVTGKHLSMAVKPEAPLGGEFEIRLRAPDSSNRVVSSKLLPADLEDWMRVDMGFTQGGGSPQLDDVQSIRVHLAGNEETNVGFWIDDFRMTESAGDSYVILAFLGGYESYYDEVFPMLEERGMQAAIPVRPAAVGGTRIKEDQLLELRDAGWDVCSYPSRGEPLPAMSAEEQREVIEGDQALLADWGFEDGSRHFFSPRNRLSAETLNILADVHDTGFVYGVNSAGMPPTEPLAIPTINGENYESSRSVILRADLHEQLVTLVFDGIGEDGVTIEDLEAQLDRIEENEYAGGLNVITPSQLVDEFL